MVAVVDLSSIGAIVFGVANHRSIAWAIARRLHEAGAHLTLAYQNNRLRDSVSRLVDGMERTNLLECDLSDDIAIEEAFGSLSKLPVPLGIVVHSVAFANKEELEGEFSKTSRDGFDLALGVSAYSLIPVTRLAADHMPNGGSVITMTFHAAEKVYPGYNVMGVAKAALENEVRQLAAEYGSRNIRINAISAGPLNTLAARGIHGFTDMQRIHAERAPLKRNITQDEVGDVALFLASSLSTGITGTVIPVDAGYHIMGL